MHKHDHCKHARLKYCVDCQKPHCLECGEEWNAEKIVYRYFPNWYYQYPNTIYAHGQSGTNVTLASNSLSPATPVTEATLTVSNNCSHGGIQ